MATASLITVENTDVTMKIFPASVAAGVDGATRRLEGEKILTGSSPGAWGTLPQQAAQWGHYALLARLAFRHIFTSFCKNIFLSNCYKFAFYLLKFINNYRQTSTAVYRITAVLLHFRSIIHINFRR